NFVYWREDGESGRTGVLLVEATGRHVDGYSWVPARITHGIPIPRTGGAAAADLAEWQYRPTCSGLTAQREGQVGSVGSAVFTPAKAIVNVTLPPAAAGQPAPTVALVGTRS